MFDNCCEETLVLPENIKKGPTKSEDVITVKVILHYGPSESEGIVNHRTKRINGIIRLLEYSGIPYELRQIPYWHQFHAEINKQTVYVCKLTNISFINNGNDFNSVIAFEAIKEAYERVIKYLKGLDETKILFQQNTGEKSFFKTIDSQYYETRFHFDKFEEKRYDREDLLIIKEKTERMNKKKRLEERMKEREKMLKMEKILETKIKLEKDLEKWEEEKAKMRIKWKKHHQKLMWMKVRNLTDAKPKFEESKLDEVFSLGNAYLSEEFDEEQSEDDEIESFEEKEKSKEFGVDEIEEDIDSGGIYGWDIEDTQEWPLLEDEGNLRFRGEDDFLKGEGPESEDKSPTADKEDAEDEEEESDD